MNSSANNTAAAATQTLFASVAAAAVCPSATDPQRAAAMHHHCACAVLGAPSFPAATTPAGPPPSFAAATAAATAATVGTAGTIAPWSAGILFGVVPDLHLHDFTVRDDGHPWYAVIRGRSVGITQDHNLASQAVLGVSNNGWKSHKTLQGALNEFNHALDLNLVEVHPF
ncbi:hypothetical protein C8F04DRAFT_1269683 [Mycena alexandri]|uniref:Ribonuclease H1 N-terminal domain-containing protein n=1 Tax=Mycena alexandri TaxID=1745969 RepID=A0AAD6WVP0_9AGAR|nr:hypothetical protein C8F04DRAFT_1269683 [Mycena alexandri]